MSHQTTLLINFFVSMLAITNPIGNLAIFIGLVADKTKKEKQQTAITTAFACLIVFLIITWFGEYLLSFLGISIGAFQAAGGLIIILLGLSMLHSKTSEMSHTPSEQADAVRKDSIAVVPMAIPIIAGPGAMTNLLIAMHSYPSVSSKLAISAVDVAITLIIAATLFFAGPISRMLGVSGIKIATRVMGLVLVAIAMEMLGNGMLALLPGLAA